jgi:hypothetical protein
MCRLSKLPVVISISLLALVALMSGGCRLPSSYNLTGRTEILRAQSSDDTELFPSPKALNVPIAAAALNDTARFLAGLPALDGQNVLPRLRSMDAWKEHSAQLGGMWQQFTARHGVPVNNWARTEISDLRAANAVLYPFSGPDFVFPLLFFPKAETYVLCGLEPCEPLPAWSTLSAPEVENGLNGLVTSLSTILQHSYFITKDMRHDLQSTRFRGVLPIFMVFLARAGHVVESVDAVRLDSNGAPLIYTSGQATVPGLLIRANGPGGPKRIFYFSQDLSDDGLRPGSPFLRFASSLGRPAAMLKSASYLLHEGNFSTIRNHLLTNTCGVVEDPSGIPLRRFKEYGWSINYYGNYQGTIGVFSQYSQPDLMAAYRDPANHAQPLGFSIGYLLDPQTTSLLVGRPR